MGCDRAGPGPSLTPPSPLSARVMCSPRDTTSAPGSDWFPSKCQTMVGRGSAESPSAAIDIAGPVRAGGTCRPAMPRRQLPGHTETSAPYDEETDPNEPWDSRAVRGGVCRLAAIADRILALSTLALAQQIPTLGDAQMRVVKRPVARPQAAPSVQPAIVQEPAPTPLQLIVEAGHGRKCSMVKLPKSKAGRSLGCGNEGMAPSWIVSERRLQLLRMSPRVEDPRTGSWMPVSLKWGERTQARRMRPPNWVSLRSPS